MITIIIVCKLFIFQDRQTSYIVALNVTEFLVASMLLYSLSRSPSLSPLCLSNLFLTVHRPLQNVVIPFQVFHMIVTDDPFAVKLKGQRKKWRMALENEAAPPHPGLLYYLNVELPNIGINPYSQLT